MRFRLLVLLLGLLVGGAGATTPGRSAVASGVTFNQEISRLLQQHCQECHRPGGGAPFELVEYEHVYRRRDKILAAMEKRSMPPWKALQGYGEFIGERRLSAAEIAMVARWVADGAPQGDPRDLPPPRQWSSGPLGGKPDLVLRPDQPFTVPARSGDIYRCFSVATSFPEDGYLGGWAPGARPWDLPEGVGMLLPKGARIVFQLHYHNQRLMAETDHTELRLRAASGPVQKRLHFMRVGQFRLTIPAGAARHEIEAQSFVHQPMQLIAIHPHMHLLGREMKVWARMKDESTQPLIHIDDWDFHWQGFYFYRKPVALPVGSWIELTAAWDNSEQNPRNPNKPPREVSWGEKTTDEMGHAAILYTIDNEQLP